MLEAVLLNQTLPRPHKRGKNPTVTPTHVLKTLFRQVVPNKILEELEALRVTQRYMVRGLEHEFLFEQKYVEDVACSDEVDRAILEELHYADRMACCQET